MTALTEQALMLSRPEKLQLLEDIWADLTSADDSGVTPSWHEEELQRRAEAIERGEASFSPIEETFQRIEDRIRSHQVSEKHS